MSFKVYILFKSKLDCKTEKLVTHTEANDTEAKPVP